MENFQNITINSSNQTSTAYGDTTKYIPVECTNVQKFHAVQYARVFARATGNLGAVFTCLAVLADPTNKNNSGDMVRDVRTLVVTNSTYRCDSAGTGGSYLCTVAIDGGGNIFDLAGATPKGWEWRIGSPNTMNTATAVILTIVPIAVI